MNINSSSKKKYDTPGYYIEVGRYRGSYKLRVRFDLGMDGSKYLEALAYYDGINIANGYKKRMVKVGSFGSAEVLFGVRSER
jgi:hypothetical protein